MSVFGERHGIITTSGLTTSRSSPGISLFVIRWSRKAVGITDVWLLEESSSNNTSVEYKTFSPNCGEGLLKTLLSGFVSNIYVKIVRKHYLLTHPNYNVLYFCRTAVNFYANSFIWQHSVENGHVFLHHYYTMEGTDTIILQAR